MNVATDKSRVSTYISEALRADIEKLAQARGRSLSNLIERILMREVAKAKEDGEIPDDRGDSQKS